MTGNRSNNINATALKSLVQLWDSNSIKITAFVDVIKDYAKCCNFLIIHGAFFIQ
jgi:hypothetical protein